MQQRWGVLFVCVLKQGSVYLSFSGLRDCNASIPTFSARVTDVYHYAREKCLLI